MPLPFNFPYTRLLVALLLVALAVPAAFASTTVDAGDDFEPPTLDLNDGGQFLFWNIGGDLVAADVFATVKIAWLFDNALVSWTSFVPALGVVNFPLVDGAVLWIVSEGPQSIVVPGLEPPEPKQPETPDEPEQPVDEPLTGPPDLVGIVFDREDYGDAFEGFLQDPDLTGELDAEQYGAEFETGGAVEARGFVAAVQQAFDAPDFADAALNTAGLAPEGEFITVFTTATRWTDSDAAALDVDSFARHLFDIDVLEVDRLTRLDSLGHDAFFAITSNPGITLLTVVFSLGQYGAAATLGVSQQPDEAALAAPSDLVLDWARVLESRIAAIPNVAGPPLTLSLADFGAQFQDWVIDLRASGPIALEDWSNDPGPGFVRAFDRVYDDPASLQPNDTSTGLIAVSTDIAEWSTDAEAIKDLTDFVDSFEAIGADVQEFGQYPDGAFGTSVSIAFEVGATPNILFFLRVRVGRLIGEVTMTLREPTDAEANAASSLQLDLVDLLAERLAAGQ